MKAGKLTVEGREVTIGEKFRRSSAPRGGRASGAPSAAAASGDALVDEDGFTHTQSGSKGGSRRARRPAAQKTA